MSEETVIRKELFNNLTKETVQLLTEDEVKYLYFNQYDEELNLPMVDRFKDEGDWVYHIYCGGGLVLCRLFKDPNDSFNDYLLEMFEEEEAY